MNETQLISQLTAALDGAAAPVRMPAGAAERARARARRRRLTRGAATAIPAAGLAPALLTVGYVTSRAKAAAADMSSMIVRQTHGGTVTWFDYGKVIARYQTHGSGGRLVSDEREWYTGQTTRHRVYIDYRARTWWTRIPSGHPGQRGGLQRHPARRIQAGFPAAVPGRRPARTRPDPLATAAPARAAPMASLPPAGHHLPRHLRPRRPDPPAEVKCGAGTGRSRHR